MKPRNRDCKSANADSQAAITIAARQTRVVGMQSRLQRCKRQLSGCQSRLQRGKRQLSACNPDCSVANANCQPAIPIAARQTPIVSLQSRLQRGKRQLSACNPDCSAANANCQPAATTGNRCPQSPCSAPKFVTQYFAILMQPTNDFPAQFDL